MHEMALCQSMVELINDQQRELGFDHVTRVIVEVGALGHVDPHALEFAFEVGAKGSVAENATLEIRETPGKGWCMACSETVSIARRGEPCPSCDSYQLIVEQGEELKLKELEVA
ncbi:MAG: hydrogenase maturation nickel metallochaperone HypA [Pseudomonadota bacterium]